jgi:hypothetical protein
MYSKNKLLITCLDILALLGCYKSF